jgi:hypothetical protein
VRKEELEAISELLDRPIAFQRSFAHICGDACAGLMLSQLLYWSSRTGDCDGWCYKSAREWSEETGLSRYEQETARRILREKEFMEEALRKMPATKHYRLRLDKIKAALVQYGENQQTSMGKTNKLVRGKAASMFAGNQQTSLGKTNTLLTKSTSKTFKEEQRGESKPPISSEQAAIKAAAASVASRVR